MSLLPTLAEVQDRAAAGAGRQHLPGSEVQGFAAGRGISPRSLRRFVGEGLVAAPERIGRGRGRGVEVRYPVRALPEIALVAEARKETHSLPGVRHWLWWIGYPIEWLRWRSDRISELSVLAGGEQATFGMSRPQRDREAAKLAAELGRRRPFPLRHGPLRTDAVRGGVVQAIFDGRYQGEAPDPEEGLDEGRGTTVGGLLGRLVAEPLRSLGVADEPATVGAQVAALLPTVPTFDSCLTRFAGLTEREARGLWVAAIYLGSRGLFRALGYSEPRGHPVHAALALASLQWWLPAPVIEQLAAFAY